MYNFTKKTCDICNISEEERNKKPPMQTGINHPVYCETKSFSLGYDGSVLCPERAKEKNLESLFVMMDEKDKKRKQKGFTILELLVCVVILTIIASLTFPVIQRVYNKTKQKIKIIESKNKTKIDTFLFETEQADIGIRSFMYKQEAKVLGCADEEGDVWMTVP